MGRILSNAIKLKHALLRNLYIYSQEVWDNPMSVNGM